MDRTRRQILHGLGPGAGRRDDGDMLAQWTGGGRNPLRYPDEHVVVARRRSTRWFLDAMTNEEGRQLRISTDFLRTGRWKATVYADDAPEQKARMTPAVISEQAVQAGHAMDLHLAPSGGQAILFEPAG